MNWNWLENHSIGLHFVLFYFSLAHKMHFVLAHGITERLENVKAKNARRTTFNSHAWIRVNSTNLILITVKS